MCVVRSSATHFRAFRQRSLSAYSRCPEARWTLFALVLGSLIVASFLLRTGTYFEPWTALRYAFFNTVSVATTAGFAKDVLEASRKVAVLVHFTSDRSQPCKQLGPILEKVVREQKGRVRLVRMNIETHPTIPNQLRIQAVPIKPNLPPV